MALHGPVMVNEQKIGHWYARRLQPLANVYSPDNEVHTYECDYTWFDEAFSVKTSQRFLVEHRYGDGAIELAIKVMAGAAESIPKPHTFPEDGRLDT